MAVQVISFYCVLKNNLGHVISSTFNRDVLTGGSHKAKNLDALAQALQNLHKGEKRKINLRAEQAYGYYNPDLVMICPIEDIEFNEPVAVGEQITYIKDGKKKSYWVTEVTGNSVTLDGNHPLAGQDLIFEIETTEAREATVEDLGDFDHSQRGVPTLLH